MGREQQLDHDLLDSLYGAVNETGSWERFLAGVASRVTASSVAFLFHSHADHRYELNPQFGLAPEVVPPYAEYYGKIDPLCAYGEADPRCHRGEPLPGPLVVLGSSICSPSRVRESEFYSDYVKKYGTFGYQAGVILQNAADEHLVLTCLREPRQADFSRENVRFLSSLAPHLRWSLQIQRKMAVYKEIASAYGRALNQVDIGLIGIQANGGLAFANPKAESLLRSGNLLSTKNGKIACMDGRQNSTFRRLWQSASFRSTATLPGGALTLRQGPHSLHVTVLPWGNDSHLLCATPVALLILTDPKATPRRRHSLLQQLFGLTPMQADISMLLMKGLQSKQIADQIGCTADDARYHLAKIYNKVNVHGQTQLVRLISLLPGHE